MKFFSVKIINLIFQIVNPQGISMNDTNDRKSLSFKKFSRKAIVHIEERIVFVIVYFRLTPIATNVTFYKECIVRNTRSFRDGIFVIMFVSARSKYYN